jgi:glycosyltransferase involved in cell wall biosynthesis
VTRVCLFGAWDPGYPRNRVVRAGLALAGHEVLEARVDDRRAFRRYPALAAAWSRVAAGTQVVFVPEFRHKDVPLASRVRGRRPLVFDPLVSRWDTLVEDWGLHAPGSLQARWNRAIDRSAFRAADLLLCDTHAHGELFVSLGADPARLHRVAVGAEQAFFEVPAPPAPAPVTLVYIGGFLPLHGTGTLLAAAARLEARAASLPPFRLRMVGVGIEFDEARSRVAEQGLQRVEFVGRTAYAEAAGVLAGAHVVLGAFGAGEKAGRVVPHKVWQGLAAGRAVVTGDGPGPREFLRDGEHARLVPRADADALADALATLIASAEDRARLGAGGRAVALAHGSPAAVGRQLDAALRRLA